MKSILSFQRFDRVYSGLIPIDSYVIPVMAKLTKRLIDAMAPKDTDYLVWDDEVTGFGIRVWPTGKKVYVAQYRGENRIRRMKIGNHGILTVEEARKEARVLLGDVARGQDPQEDKLTKRKAMTVKDLCERYIAAGEQGLLMGKRGKPKKDSTQYVDNGRIRRHIIPLIGARPVVDLTQADVVRMMRDITTGKTATVEKTEKKRGKAIVEGGAGTAGKAVTLVSAMLSFAQSEGIVQFNVARGIKKPAIGKRTRRLTAQEYRALGVALQASDNEPWQAIAGIWLFCLTGFRLSEIAGLMWSEVDEAGSALRLDDSKEDASVRPIGSRVFEVLRSIRKVDGNPFILVAPKKDGGHYSALDDALDRVTATAGLSGVTSHTLRHSFASVAGDIGFTEITIAALLGHSAANVTQRYVHHLDAVLIAAAEKVSGEVHRMMTEDQ